MLALTAWVLAAGAPIMAQNVVTPQIETQGQQPQQQTQEQKKAQQAAAQLPLPVAPGRVSYAEVLAHPDDIELNFRFAGQQVKDGDLKGASATLERLLMVNPQLAKVRLLYAVVLYRLNDLTEAQRELERLQATQLPSEVRAQISRYLGAIAGRRKRTHLDGSVGVGMEYDNNRNAAPSSGRFLFDDVPVNASASSQRTQDTAIVTMGDVDLTHKLDSRNELFTQVDYYRADQTVLKTLDLEAFAADAGDTWRTPWGFTLRPSGVFDHVLLAQATFLREEGGELRAEKRLDRKNLVFADLREVYSDFQPTSGIPIADELRGNQYDLKLGWQRALNPEMRLDTTVGFTRKNAAASYWAYDRALLGVAHTWLLPRQTFLISAAEFHYDQYDAPELDLSNKTRVDETGRFDLTYGVPLSLISPRFQSLLATLNYEYYHAFSSLLNYAYTNNKIVGMITYRWGVGL